MKSAYELVDMSRLTSSKKIAVTYFRLRKRENAQVLGLGNFVDQPAEQIKENNYRNSQKLQSEQYNQTADQE